MGSLNSRVIIVGWAVLAGASLTGHAWAEPNIAVTRHNLSVTGPGQVRSAQETEICIFCHASHVEDVMGPLWNRKTSGNVAYEPYQSSTLESDPIQPDGATLMCLSCHDGTIALGAVSNRATPIQMLGGGAFGRMPVESGANLGTDLSGTHPVSIEFDKAVRRQGADRGMSRLRDEPLRLGTYDLLDKGRKVQCTSCHDPHEDPAAMGADVPPFWCAGTFDEVCTACHVAPLVHQGHTPPSLPWGCGGCHVGHGVPQQPLLPAAEEQACFGCHGDAESLSKAKDAGRVSQMAGPPSVEPMFSRPYRHPVDATWLVHDPAEDLAQNGASVPRHVECVDCHQTHGEPVSRAPISPRVVGLASPRSMGEQPEYELCYLCHSSSSNLPYGQWDKAAEFNPSNESFHPVEAPNGRRSVPSLRSPWLSGDVMTCSDCHGSDDASDPLGPHGSRNEWILRGAYEVDEGIEESERSYQLCYGCHSRDSILNDESFEEHKKHIVEERAPCSACHDPHGVSYTQGDTTNHTHLINFDRSIVFPSEKDELMEFSDLGPRTGKCYLTCHDEDHDPENYDDD